jgi:sec-independent protein translocase protein TatA
VAGFGLKTNPTRIKIAEVKLMFALDKPFVWLIILVIILVLFGASRLPDVGKSLGKSINNFKEEMGSEAKGGKKETVETTTEPVSKVVNGNAAEDVVITRKERTREDGTVEVVEERVIRKN